MTASPEETEGRLEGGGTAPQDQRANNMASSLSEVFFCFKTEVFVLKSDRGSMTIFRPPEYPCGVRRFSAALVRPLQWPVIPAMNRRNESETEVSRSKTGRAASSDSRPCDAFAKRPRRYQPGMGGKAYLWRRQLARVLQPGRLHHKPAPQQPVVCHGMSRSGMMTSPTTSFLSLPPPPDC